MLFQLKRVKANLYKDCSELPIVIFFKVIETGDFTLLLKSGKADHKILVEHWENILFEFEKLTNTGDYRMQLREAGENVKAVNRINALIALYYLSAFGGEDIKPELEYWDVNGSDYNAAKLEIMRERTRLNIEAIQQSKPKEKHDFYDLWTAVENGLQRNIDVDNCSVKKWVSLCKSLEQKAKQLNKHGRQDKS